MSPRAKSFAFFAIGVVSGIALTLGSLVLLYLLVAKPMTDRAMKTIVARPPPFPAQHQKAVFEASWQRSDRSQVDFATMRGKVVVLNVWATWCPPCMAELPSLAQLAAHYAGQEDLKVVCVSEEQVSRIWPKMSTHEAASILVSTDGHRLPAVYQTSAIPATFVINKGGDIVFQHVGSANWASEETFRFLDNLRKDESNESPLQMPVSATPVATPQLSLSGCSADPVASVLLGGDNYGEVLFLRPGGQGSLNSFPCAVEADNCSQVVLAGEQAASIFIAAGTHSYRVCSRYPWPMGNDTDPKTCSSPATTVLVTKGRRVVYEVLPISSNGGTEFSWVLKERSK